jgi:hypothetical protein
MPIKTPRFPEAYPDRDLDCQEALETALQSLIEDAQQSGWKRTESFDAIEELIRNFRLAYAEDPDPADDQP